jgi:hypothetical protein
MNDCFLHIESYAHGHLVERVMALHGRGSSNPKQYRLTLECMSSAALSRAIEESDFPALPEALHSAEANSRVPDGEASNGRSELPARETLILESSLP